MSLSKRHSAVYLTVLSLLTSSSILPTYGDDSNDSKLITREAWVASLKANSKPGENLVRPILWNDLITRQFSYAVFFMTPKKDPLWGLLPVQTHLQQQMQEFANAFIRLGETAKQPANPAASLQLQLESICADLSKMKTLLLNFCNFFFAMRQLQSHFDMAELASLRSITYDLKSYKNITFDNLPDLVENVKSIKRTLPTLNSLVNELQTSFFTSFGTGLAALSVKLNILKPHVQYCNNLGEESSVLRDACSKASEDIKILLDVLTPTPARAQHSLSANKKKPASSNAVSKWFKSLGRKVDRLFRR